MALVEADCCNDCGKAGDVTTLDEVVVVLLDDCREKLGGARTVVAAVAEVAVKEAPLDH